MKILNFIIPIMVTTIWLLSLSGGLTIVLALFFDDYCLYELFKVAMLINWITFFITWLSVRGDKK